MTYLSAEQVGQLLKGINPLRVGKTPQGMAHVEAYEIRAHLNRIFGFARWSADVTDQQMVYEEENTLLRKDKKTQKPIPGSEYQAWSVCYRSVLRLTLCAPDGTVLCTYTEGATGASQNQPSRSDAHDNALKTSESQALKRAAHNAGDQFGLSLWGKGSTAAIVKRVLVGVGETFASDVSDVSEHIREPLPPEVDSATGEILEPRPQPAKVSDMDARQAAAKGVSVEQERADRLAEAKVRRDALGVDSTGRLKASERTNITRSTGPVEDDPWAGRADPWQEPLT